MPDKVVDQDTMNVLHVAQAAINYTRALIRYGSANQRADLERRSRGGAAGVNVDVLPRLDVVRKGVKLLRGLPHAPSELDDLTYAIGLSSGVAAFYGAGNCGEHAAVAYCYLSRFGFPGLRIRLCSLRRPNDHAFVLLSSDGGPEVVSDPWPSNAQAVLYEDHFAYGAAKDELAETEVTRDTMGDDPMVRAFQAVDPDAVNALPSRQRVAPVPESVVTEYVDVYGAYTQTYATRAQAYQDYVCDGQRLSTVLEPGEQWTGRPPAVLTDVVLPIGERAGLDPGLRDQ